MFKKLKSQLKIINRFLQTTFFVCIFTFILIIIIAFPKLFGIFEHYNATIGIRSQLLLYDNQAKVKLNDFLNDIKFNFICFGCDITWCFQQNSVLRIKMKHLILKDLENIYSTIKEVGIHILQNRLNEIQLTNIKYEEFNINDTIIDITDGSYIDYKRSYIKKQSFGVLLLSVFKALLITSLIQLIFEKIDLYLE